MSSSEVARNNRDGLFEAQANGGYVTNHDRLKKIPKRREHEHREQIRMAGICNNREHLTNEVVSILYKHPPRVDQIASSSLKTRNLLITRGWTERPNMFGLAPNGRTFFRTRNNANFLRLGCLELCRGFSVIPNSDTIGTKSRRMESFTYTCAIDAEPLHRYKSGGYHPIHLGDCLNQGRYRILHKLGWGGYSTVWAAKDQKLDIYVAVKISVSEIHHHQMDRYLEIMRRITRSSSTHLGAGSVVQMLEHFQLQGPNGTHECLVLELLGPSIPDVLDVRFKHDRLPAKLAKRVAREALLGLDYLHQHGIGHGGMMRKEGSQFS